MSVSVKQKKPSSLRNDLSRHLWVAIFVFQNEHQQPSKLDIFRLKIWMMVGWEPMISWGGRNSKCFPHLGGGFHGAPWAEAFVNPIASRNQHPLHHFLHSQGPDSKLTRGTSAETYGKNSMVLESWLISWKKHGSVIWHLNVGIKFEGQPFKFRDEWRFGTKESPGFQPREFPWNESPGTGSGVIGPEGPPYLLRQTSKDLPQARH